MILPKKVSGEFPTAIYCAEQGAISEMELILILDKSLNVAQKKEIEDIGYTAAIPIKLAVAKEYAIQGNIPGMETALMYVRKYEKKVGQDVSVQRKEIEDIGYIAAVLVKYVDVKKHIEQGNIPARKIAVGRLITYAKKVN